ncbi:DUF4347 domain-containing protein [Gloeothece verrucosa]|uniref:LVIVD repeat protein n=1 Tax=Gloeothece verrucosa (strain PCC 7822) TaxID=497965 RepID=E0ULA3_GLOV7|nr:DUF4347 domain-containing protein [Gloeothece verrucosa]ADN17733.1 LVIVD repeat protein [Gloeothece verrucosa PCC 7822]
MKNNCQQNRKKIEHQKKYINLSLESLRKKRLSKNLTDELSSLVIIDSGVKDYQQLLKGVKQGITALTLSSYLDPIAQITSILVQNPEITTLHLVSHGSPGCLYLGNKKLNLNTLTNYQQQLKQWKIQQILLYGCNVAAQDGKEFLTKLHQLTGATIQASESLTGNATLGGNWQLEFTVQDTATSELLQIPEIVFRSEILKQYQSILAAPALVGVWERISNISDVALVGNYAYAVGDGLEVIDISDLSDPMFRTFTNKISGSVIKVTGNRAYVAAGNTGLQIIDTSNPTQPTLLGTYDTVGSANDVTVVDNIAYVADGSAGLQIIDISNPAQPVLLGTYDTPNEATDVEVAGNTAYLVGGLNSQLQIINITNPSQPLLLGTYGNFSYARDVEVAGNIAYVLDYNSGLQIIDVSNPTQPASLGSYGPFNAARDLEVAGNTAYITSYYGINTIDISNPAQPVSVGYYGSPGTNGNLTLVDNTAYWATRGIEILNISNPAQPERLGGYGTAANLNSVAVVGNTAYLAGNGEIEILNISNPAQPELLDIYDTPGNATDLTVIGNTAYVADGNAGLQILDISNRSQPSLLRTYDTPGYAQDVTVVGNTAYVADGDAGLQIVNIAGITDTDEPAEPALLGTYDPSNSVQDVTVVGNTAYITDIAGILQILDISNPAQPTLLGSYDSPAAANEVTVVGNIAYLANGEAGLQILDISNRSQPTLLGSYDTPGSASNVTVVGFTAYVADGEAGLQILDISNPAQPTLKGTYDNAGSPFDTNSFGYPLDLTVANNYAYLVSTGGLEIIDVNNVAPNPVNPNNPDSLLNTPVYRFYNPNSQEHFFTINSTERDSVIANPAWGYQYEGIGFYASTIPGDNLLPIFRFYSPNSAEHLLTATVEERDNLLAHPEWGYNYEGIGMYAYGADANRANDIFRFYNASSAKHFLTATVEERDNLLAHPEWGYTYEGVAFEAG